MQGRVETGSRSVRRRGAPSTPAAVHGPRLRAPVLLPIPLSYWGPHLATGDALGAGPQACCCCCCWGPAAGPAARHRSRRPLPEQATTEPPDPGGAAGCCGRVEIILKRSAPLLEALSIAGCLRALVCQARPLQQWIWSADGWRRPVCAPRRFCRCLLLPPPPAAPPGVRRQLRANHRHKRRARPCAWQPRPRPIRGVTTSSAPLRLKSWLRRAAVCLVAPMHIATPRSWCQRL